MTRREFDKRIKAVTTDLGEMTDAHGAQPTVNVVRLFRRKAVEVTFWNGLTPEGRRSLLDGQLEQQRYGYPCVFDNHKGGGIVQSYTVIWTESIY